MLARLIAFTHGGFVLWQHDIDGSGSAPLHHVINRLIRTLLVQQRGSEEVFQVDQFEVQWEFANERHLVFAVIYEKALQLPFLSDILHSFRKRFLARFYKDESTEKNTAATAPIIRSIPSLDTAGFDEEIDKIVSAAREKRAQEKRNVKASGPRKFEETKKGQEVTLDAEKKKKKKKKKKGGEDEEEESNDTDTATKPGKPTGGRRAGPRAFQPKKKPKSGGGGSSSSKPKPRRRSNSDDLDLDALDFSVRSCPFLCMRPRQYSSALALHLLLIPSFAFLSVLQARCCLCVHACPGRRGCIYTRALPY
eukprot:TRINITY_DN5039_c0_g1_i1.p1 TRINITY_DN5039_c0_g1~~TRINITY_DN5039_c0_g1_i1.p1  ORF type:complete len:317 (+),score=93.49 TRINITY_DN5039_c0_g1_i1:30-953(+)